MWYYLVLLLAVITIINTIWTLLDHKGMSRKKIALSCFIRAQFVLLVLFIVYFNIDLSTPIKIVEKIGEMIKRKKNTATRA